MVCIMKWWRQNQACVTEYVVRDDKQCDRKKAHCYNERCLPEYKESIKRQVTIIETKKTLLECYVISNLLYDSE